MAWLKLYGEACFLVVVAVSILGIFYHLWASFTMLEKLSFARPDKPAPCWVYVPENMVLLAVAAAILIIAGTSWVEWFCSIETWPNKAKTIYLAGMSPAFMTGIRLFLENETRKRAVGRNSGESGPARSPCPLCLRGQERKP